MVLGLIGDQVPGVNWVVGSTPTSSAINASSAERLRLLSSKQVLVGSTPTWRSNVSQYCFIQELSEF